MANIIWQTQNGASRIWAANTLPPVKPSGFTKFDYFFQGNDEKTYNWITNKWEISHLQFVQPSSNETVPTISVDSTVTLQPGSNALVENVGDAKNIKLKFSIPKGEKGDTGVGTPGASASIRIGNVSTTTLGPTNAAQVTVTDSDNSENNAVLNFNFGIPIGGKGDPGTNGINGTNGTSATIAVGTVTTLAAGSNATVTNSGTASAAILNFGIPQGNPGQNGTGTGGGLPTTVGRIRYCYNEADLRSAVAGIAGNTVRKIILAQEISITSTAGPIKLPNTAPTEDNVTIEFDFAGNGIFDRTTAGLPYVIGMDITDQTMAMSLANRPRRYIFRNGKMVGTKAGSGTGNLIDISCSQFSLVENMHMENAKKGIRMRFCMFGEVRNISSNDIGEILVEPTRGDWPGSGNNLCSSNQFKVSNIRAFVKDGMIAIVYSKACSGHKYELVTGEGGYAQYGIYWDYNGANEVKNGPEINLCHWEGTVESQFSTAFIYIRQGGGSRTVINQTNHQLAGATRSPLIWVQGEGGGNVVKVNNLSWLIADSKFQSTGQNFWKFEDCYDGGNLFTAGRWVGAVPNGISTYNNGTSEVVVKKP